MRFKRLIWSVLVILISLGSGYLFFYDHYPVYPKTDHYDPETQTFYNTPVSKGVEGGLGFLIPTLWNMSVNAKHYMPAQPLPMQSPDWKTFLADSNHAKFIWFGHSSLLARLNHKTILIDPVFADSVSPLPIMMHRFQAPPATLEELPTIDYIVYSHNHYDHLDKAVVKYYQNHQTKFIVPLGMHVLLEKWGIEKERIYELDWWQSIHLDQITLTAVPARHNTGRSHFDRDKSLWVGWVFQTPQEKIYYSGDSSYLNGDHFRQIAERFHSFDLAFIENGQYNPAWVDNHLLPEQTVRVAKEVNAQRFMPVHWGAYALSTHSWDDPVRRSIPLAKQQHIKTLTPILGQVFDIHSTTEEWWLKTK